MNLFDFNPHLSAARRWMQNSAQPDVPVGSLARTAPELERVLREADVRVLEVNYDGRAGVGDFTTIRCMDGDGRALRFALSDELRRQVCAVLGALREHRYPKWRSLEGAYGQFVWNVASDVLEHRHSTRFIEYETWYFYGL